MCDISDHDPESGIDGPTSNKLLSRKRASGASPIVQWREIWNILFPDDEDNSIHPYRTLILLFCLVCLGNLALLLLSRRGITCHLANWLDRLCSSD